MGARNFGDKGSLNNYYVIKDEDIDAIIPMIKSELEKEYFKEYECDTDRNYPCIKSFRLYEDLIVHKKDVEDVSDDEDEILLEYSIRYNLSFRAGYYQDGFFSLEIHLVDGSGTMMELCKRRNNINNNLEEWVKYDLLDIYGEANNETIKKITKVLLEKIKKTNKQVIGVVESILKKYTNIEYPCCN